MNAHDDDTGPRSFREWWQTPPRTGLQRFIWPWEYRHLRFFAGLRFAGAAVAATVGTICLAYSAWPWAAFFLAIAAANVAAGAWELSIARSAAAGA